MKRKILSILICFIFIITVFTGILFLSNNSCHHHSNRDEERNCPVCSIMEMVVETIFTLSSNMVINILPILLLSIILTSIGAFSIIRKTPVMLNIRLNN